MKRRESNKQADPRGLGRPSTATVSRGTPQSGARGRCLAALSGSGLLGAMGVCLAGLSPAAQAQFPVPLSPPVAANPNATSDVGEDFGNQIASDRNGMWLSLWRSSEDINGTIGTDFDVLYTRSWDGGLTWTQPAVLNSDAPFEDGRDRGPQLATDYNGAWVVVWYRLDDTHGLAEHDLWVSSSVDNGDTWSTAAQLNPSAQPGAGQEIKPQIATDRRGVWVTAWHSTDPGNGNHGDDYDIFVARSEDNGLTWSSAQALNSNAATDRGPDQTVQILTDTHGTWIAAWHSEEPMIGGVNIGTDRDILYSRSTDNGLTWEPVRALNTSASRDTGDDEFVHFTTNERGTWVAAWHSSETFGGALGTDSDILVSTSTDHGATWSDPTPLHASMASDIGDDQYPQIETDTRGNWVVVWRSHDTLGGILTPKPSVLISHSPDAGTTWTAPMPVAEFMKSDNDADGAYPHLDTDRKGRWIAQWRDKWSNGGLWGSDWDVAAVNFELLVNPGDESRLHVNHEAAPEGDGLTWETAYTDLQDALDHARRTSSVEEIWIARGTYVPDRGTGDRTLSFELVDGVDLIGGFRGGEEFRDQAQPLVNPAVLSGDINEPFRREDNSLRVVTAASLIQGLLFSGLQVADGEANIMFDWDSGAGMHIVGSRIEIVDCLFEGNRAFAEGGTGGAIYLEASEMVLRDSTFRYNWADIGGGALFGLASEYLVEYCLFTGNNSDDTWLKQDGGGAVHNVSSIPEFHYCDFESNSGYDGGAMHNTESDAVIMDCTFIGQRGRHGLGMYNYRSRPLIVNCVFAYNELEYLDEYGAGGGIFNRESIARIVNCLFADSVTGGGGGIYNVERSQSTVLNSTFANNTIFTGGASVQSLDQSESRIINSIMWNPLGRDIREVWNGRASRATVTYSIIQGGNIGTGNLDLDPMFMDPAAGNYQLMPCSPAIDAGLSDAIPGQLRVDLLNLRRRKDDPGMPDTGAGPAPLPDLGAYEFQGTSTGCN